MAHLFYYLQTLNFSKVGKRRNRLGKGGDKADCYLVYATGIVVADISILIGLFIGNVKIL